MVKFPNGKYHKLLPKLITVFPKIFYDASIFTIFAAAIRKLSNFKVIY